MQTNIKFGKKSFFITGRMAEIVQKSALARSWNFKEKRPRVLSCPTYRSSDIGSLVSANENCRDATHIQVNTFGWVRRSHQPYQRTGLTPVTHLISYQRCPIEKERARTFFFKISLSEWQISLKK